MYLVIGIIIIILFLQNDLDIITAEKAKKLIKKNHFKTILDVRSAEEWNQGHYPNAVHLPYDKITSKKVAKLKQPMLIYCKSGRRAKLAAEKMKQYGKTDLSIIETTYQTFL